MKQLRVVVLFFLMFSIVPSLGCQEVRQLLKNQEPKMKFEGLKLRDVSLVGMSLDFHFMLNNPNPIGVTFTRISYQLDFNNAKLFSGVKDRGLRIEANGTSRLVMPFSIEYVKFVKSVLGFFQASESVPYKLQLGLGFTVPVLGEINIPFTTQGNVPIPRIPKIRVVGATPPQFTGSLLDPGVTFGFQVAMKNDNSFPLNIRGFDYAFRISNNPIVSGATQVQAVGPNGEQIVNIPVTIKALQVGMAVFNVIRSRQFDYDLGGSLDLGLFKLPINLRGNLKI